MDSWVLLLWIIRIIDGYSFATAMKYNKTTIVPSYFYVVTVSVIAIAWMHPRSKYTWKLSEVMQQSSDLGVKLQLFPAPTT